jgi:DNA-binding XRE family transcriptional regulator
MECQDWTTVTIKRRIPKKEAIARGMATTVARDSERGERCRLAKLDADDVIIPKRRVTSMSLQELIRARIELGITQDRADSACSFPKHTFKEIEANRLIPTDDQTRRIQQIFSVILKVQNA